MNPNSRETQNFIFSTAFFTASAAVPGGILLYFLFRLIWRFKVPFFLSAWGAMAFCVLSSPISRDHFLGEIPHCFTDKCFVGPEAEKRLDALGVKYKDSPEEYATYKMWKFQEMLEKKNAVQKSLYMPK